MLLTPSSRNERRLWPEWKVQPTSHMAAAFLIGILGREHTIDPGIRPAAQIMGRPHERRSHGPLAVAAVLEMDTWLRLSRMPDPQNTQLRERALARGQEFFAELDEYSDRESVVPPYLREYITNQSQKPSRVVDLAERMVEGLSDYPGAALVVGEAVMALRLQIASASQRQAAA
jgi:hypothetical protein